MSASRSSAAQAPHRRVNAEQHDSDETQSVSRCSTRGDLRCFLLPLAGARRLGRRPTALAAPGLVDSTRGSGRRAATHHRYWSGHAWQLGTAAFWEQFARDTPRPETHRLGETLLEEVGACLLGGYGMPYWLAAAAFERLRAQGVFETASTWTADEVETLLSEPLRVDGVTRRYRFPRQRAVRLVAANRELSSVPIPETDTDLRDLLLTVPGIGPKTAAWVVRNHRGSDAVVIVDIHLMRAGVVAGVFSPQWRLPVDYGLFEAAFLAWACHAELSASHLDACVWGMLARGGEAGRHILGVRSFADPLLPVWRPEPATEPPAVDTPTR